MFCPWITGLSNSYKKRMVNVNFTVLSAGRCAFMLTKQMRGQGVIIYCCFDPNSSAPFGGWPASDHRGKFFASLAGCKLRSQPNRSAHHRACPLRPVDIRGNYRKIIIIFRLKINGRFNYLHTLSIRPNKFSRNLQFGKWCDYFWWV